MEINHIETEIRAKLVNNQKLEPREEEIVKAILNADEKTSVILKKQYPELHFYLTLKKIERNN